MLDAQFLLAQDCCPFVTRRYQYRLTRPPQGLEVGDFILDQSPDLIDNYWGGEPISVPFNAFTNTWTLHMYRISGWCPSWQGPLIAVVVIISCVMSLLVGIIMVNTAKS